jgi:CcmD family protein
MENVPDTFLQLCVAYTACWLLIAFYIFTLSRRIARLEQENRS